MVSMLELGIPKKWCEGSPLLCSWQAAQVRNRAKEGDPSATSLACRFMSQWPPSYWNLVLLEVWQQALTRRATAALEQLGSAVSDLSRDGLGTRLWESLLDAPAHVACGTTAMDALKALEHVQLDASHFPSVAHRDYFRHFRLLMAMERVGANQARPLVLHSILLR